MRAAPRSDCFTTLMKPDGLAATGTGCRRRSSRLPSNAARHFLLATNVAMGIKRARPVASCPNGLATFLLSHRGNRQKIEVVRVAQRGE